MPSNNQKVTAADISQETEKTKKDKLYNQYVSQVTPKHNWFLNLCKAFLTGGIICTIGQGFLNLYMSAGNDKDTSAAYTTASLVLLAVLFTGFNWYQKFAKLAGAGSVVPITGFANSVAAPAIEFQKEGQVFGIGTKIFTIAGPVILYGVFSSWVVGILYMIWNQYFAT